MGRKDIVVELSQNGHKIGKLERDGNVWYWEAYDKSGSVAAGWTYEKDKAITKLHEVRKGL